MATLLHSDADRTEWAVELDGDVLVEFGEDEAGAWAYAESRGGSVMVRCFIFQK